MKIIEIYKKARENKIIFYLLIISAVVPSLLGIWQYYEFQLQTAPIWLWVFIVDCPLAVIVFLIALFKKKKNDYISAFAATGMIKLGVSAALLWPIQGYYALTIFPGILVFLAHISMVIVTPFIFLRKSKFKFLELLPGIVFYFANDLLDFYAGTMPFLVAKGTETVFIPIALFMTFVAPAYLISHYPEKMTR